MNLIISFSNKKITIKFCLIDESCYLSIFQCLLGEKLDILYLSDLDRGKQELSSCKQTQAKIRAVIL
jgi:hypothetical protein